MSELPHIRCPECIAREGEPDGWIFEDARGGFECTVCDARFAIYREPPHGYGGPHGPLSWFERQAFWFERAGWLALGGAIGAPGWGVSLCLMLVAVCCFLALSFAIEGRR